MTQIVIAAAVVVILGIVAFFFIGRKPELFWLLLIALPIAAAGFMIAGRAVVDEYFLAAVVAGGFLAAKRGLVPARTAEKISPHFWIFLITVVYFVLQSIRGAIAFDDIKILRWVGYFLLFGILLMLIGRWRFPLPAASLAAKIGGVASSFYFGSYLLLGLFHECLKGVARWGFQGMIWAGSSSAIFPIIFSFPLAIYLLKSEDKNSRRLGWITLFTSVLSVGYYESRVGWLVIIVMILLIPLVLGFRRTLTVLPGLVAISGLALFWALGVFATSYCHTFLTGQETLNEALERLFDAKRYVSGFIYFIKGIAETVIDPVTPRISDIDRALHLKAAFLTATETPLRFFFGSGTYSYRSLLYLPLQELYAAKLPGVEVSPTVRTVGLSAILVDFGFIGFALIILNLILVMKALVAGRRFFEWRRASIFLFPLFLIPFWLSVSDIQNVVIYFLLLMPENIFTLLGRNIKTSNVLTLGKYLERLMSKS